MAAPAKSISKWTQPLADSKGKNKITQARGELGALSVRVTDASVAAPPRFDGFPNSVPGFESEGPTIVDITLLFPPFPPRGHVSFCSRHLSLILYSCLLTMAESEMALKVYT